jgi:hypothetical protein
MAASVKFLAPFTGLTRSVDNSVGSRQSRRRRLRSWLLSSVDSLEPGVFGTWRPVLMWPREIERHLDLPAVDAVLPRKRTNQAARTSKPAFLRHLKRRRVSTRAWRQQ